MVEISAKTKSNLDKLIEAIILQAEILDLKTDFESKATGVVLESKLILEEVQLQQLLWLLVL